MIDLLKADKIQKSAYGESLRKPISASHPSRDEFGHELNPLTLSYNQASPSVSVVIPCLNEERFIGKVLENLAGQYDAERYEIIVADGMSTDNTRLEVERFIATHQTPRVVLIDNPSKHIPAGLNLAISQARNEIIVRMDAHSIPSANYVRRCVDGLYQPDVAIVGMPWRITAVSEDTQALAIAQAVSHPFCIGDAQYRLSNSSATFVDTVPFGAFRKALWQELGGFNEELLTNEDYEFHFRVRSRGGRILLDPAGHSIYFARSSIRTLGIQYFRYGTWKARMIKLHPNSAKLRQLIAPVFVLSLALLGALSYWAAPARWLLGAIILTYAMLAALFALSISFRRRDARLAPWIALSFLTVHSTWGTGFLLGLLRENASLSKGSSR